MLYGLVSTVCFLKCIGKELSMSIFGYVPGISLLIYQILLCRVMWHQLTDCALDVS